MVTFLYICIPAKKQARMKTKKSFPMLYLPVKWRIQAKPADAANTMVAVGHFVPPDESTPPPGKAFCQMSSPAVTKQQ